MTWRDWTASPQDFAALARLNTIQYPDAPITAEGTERNWAFVDPARPTLIRFVVENGQEVALVETYPQGDGAFLLELIVPGEALRKYGLELLESAQQWVRKQGARQWILTIWQDDPRTPWLQERGFQLQDIINEWEATENPTVHVPAGVILKSVGHDEHLQEALRTVLNTARQELGRTPFTPEQFRDDVLNFGIYRPELMWLAQTPQGEPVGCACLHVWEAGEHGELSWVSVSLPWRRQGLGTALLAQTMQQAHLPVVSTRLPGQNANLNPLLHRAGFRQTEVWVTLVFNLR